jgi:HD-GYP domain-containing protein (c-di-GMP phosphodiesterase class II)
VPSLAEYPDGLRLSSVLSALSYALDITEGQLEGHSVRSCLIGMRIGEALGLDAADRSALFYALLLKDAGCSSNAARLCELFGADDFQVKRDHKLTDWSRPLPSLGHAIRNAVPLQSPLARAMRIVSLATDGKGSGHQMTKTRCERGADIARMLGFTERTAEGIRHLDEHWDGSGMPDHLEGREISLFGRIVGLAQTVEVFFSSYDHDAALYVARTRRGTWFDPELVDVFLRLFRPAEAWRTISEDNAEARKRLAMLEPEDHVVLADDDRLELVAQAFARVVDAKSPYTSRHSEGVALLAAGIAETVGHPAEEVTRLRRSALLHDIGKLGVSNLILDKRAPLTHVEREAMRLHPMHTYEILGRVPVFRGFAEMAASHHERLDGSGYHRGLRAEQFPALTRELVVADMAEALSAERPYRGPLPWDEVFAILEEDVGTAIDGRSVEGLKAFLAKAGPDPLGRGVVTGVA